MATPFRFMKPGDAEYMEAHAVFRRCSGELDTLVPHLKTEVFHRVPENPVAVDFGAATGYVTDLVFGGFHRVYAVEPVPEVRAELIREHPEFQAIGSAVLDAELPEPVDAGLLAHVLYHVPDQEWCGHIMRCARWLKPGGRLAVVLMSRYTATNNMLSYFGAPRVDLYGRVTDGFKREHPSRQYRLSFTELPAPLTTSSFEDTLAIARFMMSDRGDGVFPDRPTEQAVEAYVRKHFWDESSGTGGWESNPLVVVVERNRYFSGD